MYVYILIDLRYLLFVLPFLLIYKEDRHVALMAHSAVNATWRGPHLVFVPHPRHENVARLMAIVTFLQMAALIVAACAAMTESLALPLSEHVGVYNICMFVYILYV